MIIFGIIVLPWQADVATLPSRHAAPNKYGILPTPKPLRRIG
jgi:hypothetical protein